MPDSESRKSIAWFLFPVVEMNFYRIKLSGPAVCKAPAKQLEVRSWDVEQGEARRG